jgi:hypothetical protein
MLRRAHRQTAFSASELPLDYIGFAEDASAIDGEKLLRYLPDDWPQSMGKRLSL